MNLISLGEIGKNVVNTLTKINNLLLPLHIEIEEKENIEEYDLVSFQENTFLHLKNEEVIVVLSGADKESASSLSLLKILKTLNCKIDILYIKPESDSLLGEQALLERMVRGFLKEYTRSALLEEFFLIEVDKIIELYKGNLPIIGYYEALYQFISEQYNMYLFFKNTEPVLSKRDTKPLSYRIKTLGILNGDSENYLAEIEVIRHKLIVFAYNKNKLSQGTDMLSEIKNLMEKKSDGGIIKTGYRIYSTDYEYDYKYIIASTPIVTI